MEIRVKEYSSSRSEIEFVFLDIDFFLFFVPFKALICRHRYSSLIVYHIATQNAIHFAKKFPMGGLDFLFWFCYHKNEGCSTMYYQGGKNELFD